MNNNKNRSRFISSFIFACVGSMVLPLSSSLAASTSSQNQQENMQKISIIPSKRFTDLHQGNYYYIADAQGATQEAATLIKNRGRVDVLGVTNLPNEFRVVVCSDSNNACLYSNVIDANSSKRRLPIPVNFTTSYQFYHEQNRPSGIDNLRQQYEHSNTGLNLISQNQLSGRESNSASAMTTSLQSSQLGLEDLFVPMALEAAGDFVPGFKYLTMTTGYLCDTVQFGDLDDDVNKYYCDFVTDGSSADPDYSPITDMINDFDNRVTAQLMELQDEMINLSQDTSYMTEMLQYMNDEKIHENFNEAVDHVDNLMDAERAAAQEDDYYLMPGGDHEPGYNHNFGGKHTLDFYQLAFDPGEAEDMYTALYAYNMLGADDPADNMLDPQLRHVQPYFKTLADLYYSNFAEAQILNDSVPFLFNHDDPNKPDTHVITPDLAALQLRKITTILMYKTYWAMLQMKAITSYELYLKQWHEEVERDGNADIYNEGREAAYDSMTAALAFDDIYPDFRRCSQNYDCVIEMLQEAKETIRDNAEKRLEVITQAYNKYAGLIGNFVLRDSTTLDAKAVVLGVSTKDLGKNNMHMVDRNADKYLATPEELLNHSEARTTESFETAEMIRGAALRVAEDLTEIGKRIKLIDRDQMSMLQEAFQVDDYADKSQMSLASAMTQTGGVIHSGVAGPMIDAWHGLSFSYKENEVPNEWPISIHPNSTDIQGFWVRTLGDNSNNYDARDVDASHWAADSYLDSDSLTRLSHDVTITKRKTGEICYRPFPLANKICNDTYVYDFTHHTNENSFDPWAIKHHAFVQHGGCQHTSGVDKYQPIACMDTVSLPSFLTANITQEDLEKLLMGIAEEDANKVCTEEVIGNPRSVVRGINAYVFGDRIATTNDLASDGLHGDSIAKTQMVHGAGSDIDKYVYEFKPTDTVYFSDTGPNDNSFNAEVSPDVEVGDEAYVDVLTPCGDEVRSIIQIQKVYDGIEYFAQEVVNLRQSGANDSLINSHLTNKNFSPYIYVPASEMPAVFARADEMMGL